MAKAGGDVHAGPEIGIARAIAVEGLARVVRRVMVTGVVVMVTVMVMARRRERRHRHQDHRNQKQRQKLFHGRDYSDALRAFS